MKERCPTCNKISGRSKDANKPFCSDRCRLIDLGEWLDEKKRLPYDKVVHDENIDESYKQ